MAVRFPVTTRSGFTKASGAAPGTTLQATIEEARFLIAAGEVVAPTPPANTVAPALTGTATVGSTLSCTQGIWTGTNIVFSRQWQQNFGAGWEDIKHASDGSTFLLTSDQVSAQVRSVVRAINGAARMISAPSNASAIVT